MITQDKEIDIFVATKIGSFKHIKYHTDPAKNSKKCIENLIEIKSLQKDDGITCMVFGNEEQTEILMAKRNREIQEYDTQNGFTKTYSCDFGTGHVVGLSRIKRKLIAALSCGTVKIWGKKSEQLIQAGKMDRLRVCEDDPTLFATGGEENDVKVWRIGEPEPTFSAKNLAHDWLQLRRPLWVSDLTFLPNEGGNLLAACSRHGYVRLYDTRAQRRPVCNVEFTIAATCIAPSFDERQVLVGFGRGQLHQVDLRQSRPDKGYKGCVGAVTALATVGEGDGRLPVYSPRQVLVGFGRGQLHQVDLRQSRPDKGYKGCVGAVTALATVGQGDGRLVISTSLDRQLRVHNYESKELVYKQYLTSKLTCVLAQTASSTPLKADPEIKEEDIIEEIQKVDADEMDDLFEHMKTIGGRKSKRALPEPERKKKKLEPSADEYEGTSDEGTSDEGTPDKGEEAIVNLLRNTEKQKRKREKLRKAKKAKSVFHNA